MRSTHLFVLFLLSIVLPVGYSSNADDSQLPVSFRLTKERSLDPYGGIPFCVDLDRNGVVDVLWLQSAGMFYSKVFNVQPWEDRHTDAERQHFCLTATRADGTVMWQMGSPWQGERPFVTHSAERSIDIADIDGDGQLEVVCVKLGHILIIDATTGHVERSVEAPAARAQIVGLGRRSPRSQHKSASLPQPSAKDGPSHSTASEARLNDQDYEWNILVKNAESSYPGFEYANPIWWYDPQLKRIKTVSYLGAGHAPQARDLDGDGLDEFLVGFNLIGHDLKTRWTFHPVPTDEWNALEMHVDDLTVGTANEQTVIAYAASDTAYLVDAKDGSLLWKRQGTHPQHCQVGKFAGGPAALDVFIHNKRAELQLFNFAGEELYRIMPPTNFPLGQAQPCRRQKFHVFDPTTILAGRGAGGTDLLIFTDAGWPYVIDGAGRRCSDLPYTKNAAQDWGEVPGRPDDFGYGYYARIADFDGDGHDEVMVNDRRFVWFYEMTKNGD